MSDPSPSPAAGAPDPGPDGSDGPTRSGTAFVVGTGVFLVLFLAFILVLSPRLQDQLGLTPGSRAFDPPPGGDPVTATLTLGGSEVGTATWDAEGVCAEVTDAAGTTFRTCATADPLRPIWAIDAPEGATPPYLLVAGPDEVGSIAGVTADGESLDGLAQARELPASWTLIPLEPGQQVAELVAFNIDGGEMGDALCGTDEAPDDGSERLGGGCVVPRQD